MTFYIVEKVEHLNKNPISTYLLMMDYKIYVSEY